MVILVSRVDREVGGEERRKENGAKTSPDDEELTVVSVQMGSLIALLFSDVFSYPLPFFVSPQQSSLIALLLLL